MAPKSNLQYTCGMRKFTEVISGILRYAKTHKKQITAFFLLLLILFFFLRPKNNTPIDTVTVGKHTLMQTVSVSGSVDALQKADLSFLTAGQLVYIGATKNSPVTAGQTIAEIDPRTVEKNLQGALLAYSEQRNTYDQTIANNNNTSNPNDALNDTVKRILENNQYDLQKAVNSVELQQLAQQQSFLVSPITGVLTRADAVSIGTTATPTTIFEVVDPNSLVFSMEVDEGDIGKIKIGQQVSFSLDAYPDLTLRYPVDSIDYASHTTANGGTAYYVKVKLPGSDIDHYRLGLNGDADILTAEKKNVLIIPLSALFDDTYVYVKKNNKYAKRKVLLGLQNDTDAEVLSGLSQGDVIAVQPSKVPQNVLAK